MSKSVDPEHDSRRISRLYWSAGMSVPEIADVYGVATSKIRRVMSANGIETRTEREPVSFYFRKDGYTAWETEATSNDSSTLYTHQLVAIANGADPHDIYGESDTVVHHKNGVKWDNRPSNIQCLSRSEHAKLHVENGDIKTRGKKYSDQDLLDWIIAYYLEFNEVPASTDAQFWPGPTAKTYTDRFGSWSEALRKSGISDTEQ